MQMQSSVFSIVTPVFSVTWSFWSQSNLAIWCSRFLIIIINVENGCVAY